MTCTTCRGTTEHRYFSGTPCDDCHGLGVHHAGTSVSPGSRVPECPPSGLARTPIPAGEATPSYIAGLERAAEALRLALDAVRP